VVTEKGKSRVLGCDGEKTFFRQHLCGVTPATTQVKESFSRPRLIGPSRCDGLCNRRARHSVDNLKGKMQGLRIRQTGKQREFSTSEPEDSAARAWVQRAGAALLERPTELAPESEQ